MPHYAWGAVLTLYRYWPPLGPDIPALATVLAEWHDTRGPRWASCLLHYDPIGSLAYLMLSATCATASDTGCTRDIDRERRSDDSDEVIVPGVISTALCLGVVFVVMRRRREPDLHRMPISRWPVRRARLRVPGMQGLIWPPPRGAQKQARNRGRPTNRALGRPRTARVHPAPDRPPDVPLALTGHVGRTPTTTPTRRTGGVAVPLSPAIA